MKWLMNRIPSGVVCLIVVAVFFGYMGMVMGFANMLNTVMHTAHDLLLNTVFYIMSMCVVTGALAKVMEEFGVVALLQRMLRPIMMKVFHLPGVASLGPVLTFLSDKPVILTLARDRSFVKHFKKYQMVSLINASSGMGLLVIVFMLGQGFYSTPILGYVCAVIGTIIATRMMQYLTKRTYPSYVTDEAIDVVPVPATNKEQMEEGCTPGGDTIFVRVLNSLLDGGRGGVEIGLAIIPGVLVICTVIMMLTFGGSAEGVDANGNDIIVYTGAAYQGTQLLPWIAGKLSFVFEWLFGFHTAEIIAFPVTALGSVGAAIGLIPEFVSKGIIDDNAIAVCTAMGICWSGFLSADAASLDAMGYRHLVAQSFLSTFTGGLCAGVLAHWAYVAIMAVNAMFLPTPLWSVDAEAIVCNAPGTQRVEMTALDDGSYLLHDWLGVAGVDLQFSVNEDSTIHVKNAYAEKDARFFFVNVNKNALPGELSYVALCPILHYSEFSGDSDKGYMYVFVFKYDSAKRPLDRGYYEIVWGGAERQTISAQECIKAEIEAEEACGDSIVTSADTIGIFGAELKE